MVEAALLKVAGWCQHKQQGRMKPQQQQTNKPSGKSNKSSRGSRGKQDSTSGSSSSSGRAGAAAAGAGLEARSSSSSNTTGSRRGSSSSSMTAAAAVPGSYAQLEVPPDHDLVAVSFGCTKAVSCYSSMAGLCSSVSSQAGSSPLVFAPDAMAVLQAASMAAAGAFDFSSNTSSSSSSSSTSSSSNSSSSNTISISRSSHPGSSSSSSVWGAVSTAKLLLEVLALEGAEEEGGRSTDDSMEAVGKILLSLEAIPQLLTRAELEAFVSERGSLLLPVLSLVLDRIQAFNSHYRSSRLEHVGPS